MKQALRRLQNTGRLMMVTAHPDDEDGGVLTLQARGHGVHAVLMTLTRGEGGQNELGTGLFDKLGVIRTLELLASDRYYGVEQRFSRVADFGFSKTPEETFQNWGGKDVPLADMVRVIRTFRPDVLVARFSGTERDGHAHHQASAILTREAFRAAADPTRFPEQNKEGLQPWQPKKLYIGNVCGFRSNTCPDENWTVRFDTGEVDPVLGMSYLQMAMNGLAHQRTQGHGDYTVPPGPHYSFYKLVDSVLPRTADEKGHEKDFFDGIDTSLPPHLAELATKARQSTEKGPDEAVQPLSDLVKALEFNRLALAGVSHSDPIKERAYSDTMDKLDQAHSTLQLALGVSDSVVVTGEGTDGVGMPGQELKLNVKIHNGSHRTVRLKQVYVDGNLHHPDAVPAGLKPARILPGQDYSAQFSWKLSGTSHQSRPYWHRSNAETQGVNTIDDEQYATLPFVPDPFTLSFTYSVSGVHPVGALLSWTDGQVRVGSQGRQLAIVPPFSVALEPGGQVIPVAGGKETIVKVGVRANLAAAPAGLLHLDLPQGWRAEPANLKVTLQKRGDRQSFEFKVVPSNLKEGRSEIHAVLDAGGKTYSEGYELITREDLGSFYYYQPAVQYVSIVDVKVPKDLKVAYVMGAGDDIPTVLQQVGMNVTVWPAEKLAATELAQFGSIVLGVRAYDAQKDVVANNAKLLKFVEDGGTLVVEHNNDTGDFNGGHFTPYPAELGRARVSVEEAPVQILAPENPVFHYPNEITQKDFAAWVQERGLYFMSTWDDHFKPLISCHDPNEPDQKGGLLMSKYGKGTYIYSGYSFYRQLPAGVPGAVRLFVNLVSAGHEQ